MLTVAYCRVSTDEQAAEGYSIDGQAAKLRAYAELHELGEVVVLSDPGLSGKNLDRPGLQQLLEMVTEGHVSNVLTWRLDRLSRNLSDLILLADRFGTADVALHSFTEKIDLSSATGRMFYNILGSFAQFYREQLSENVQLGMDQAVKEGRWVNRPPTGYDLEDGILVPNGDAARVRHIFRMRADGATQGDIARETGTNYSTVLAILKNRAYLGEIKHRGEWHPGLHEPLIEESTFEAAHRGRVPGRKRGRDLMSGRVVCGGCGRRMSVMQNGKGQKHYRCKHRGEGCKMPARSNRGLLRAAALGLSLLCEEGVRQAIRRRLGADGRKARQRSRPPAPAAAERLEELHEQRRKLLQLHYDGHISGDQFGEEQARLTAEIEVLEADTAEAVDAVMEAEEVSARFEDLTQLLDSIGFDDIWEEATETEKRKLLDELLAGVRVLRDRLVVEIHGAPPLQVALSEVGLKSPPDSDFRGVGGGTHYIAPRDRHIMWCHCFERNGHLRLPDSKTGSSRSC